MVPRDAGPNDFHVLVFTRTAGYRHDAIPTAVETIDQLGSSGGYVVEATEDPAAFTAANLQRFQVVVFALTTGDVLGPTEQAAFEAWVGAGGGTIGIHSATDTEYDWPFYGDLMGAYFKSHPAIQAATVRTELNGPATTPLPPVSTRTDEWYDFRENPRGKPGIDILATVDESTYTGGTMGADHPIAWTHKTAGGSRVFYTAMGHVAAGYTDSAFRGHLLGGLLWAAGRAD